LTHYETQLKPSLETVKIDADKFLCDEPGFVVFYKRNPETLKAEEVARFKSSNVKNVSET